MYIQFASELRFRIESVAFTSTSQPALLSTGQSNLILVKPENIKFKSVLLINTTCLIDLRERTFFFFKKNILQCAFCMRAFAGLYLSLKTIR